MMHSFLTSLELSVYTAKHTRKPIYVTQVLCSSFAYGSRMLQTAKLAFPNGQALDCFG